MVDDPAGTPADTDGWGAPPDAPRRWALGTVFAITGAAALISQVASPAEAPQVYAMLAENRNPPLGIVFDWRKLR